MVMRLRKILGSLNRSNPAKPEENKLENNVVDSPEVRITEMIALEDVVEKTKDLEQTKEQLRQLSGAMYSSEGNDEARVKEALAQLLKPDGLKMATLKITPEAGEEAPAAEAPPPVDLV
ncbi:MAG: hypothetical protein Q7R57_08360, partial [Dehalococcoidales bacterium]|nr:hypothetical protein [Dehalococcoidales bacterium]